MTAIEKHLTLIHRTLLFGAKDLSNDEKQKISKSLAKAEDKKMVMSEREEILNSACDKLGLPRVIFSDVIFEMMAWGFMPFKRTRGVIWHH